MTNQSGISPIEFKIVVLPDEVDQAHRFTGKGGKEFEIWKPDTTKEREDFAQQDGLIVAVSPLAFSYATKAEWEAVGASPPKAGDRVSFARYAGALKKGRDGKDYRIINDKDIFAVLS